VEYGQIIYGAIGALCYYVLRYNRKEEFTFIEYLRLEWPIFVKGFFGFLVIWGGWSVFNVYEFIPFGSVAVPEMTPALAFFLGFAGKKLGEYTVGKLKQLGSKNG
jgi:hypothetical protein